VAILSLTRRRRITVRLTQFLKMFLHLFKKIEDLFTCLYLSINKFGEDGNCFRVDG
jgi:hypothetical protein